MEHDVNKLDQARATSSTRLLQLAVGGVALLLVIVAIFVGADRWVSVDAERITSTPTLDPCRSEGLADDPRRCPERQSYLDDQRMLHQEIKPQLEKLNVAHWSSEVWTDILDLESAALDSFGKGQYVDAAKFVGDALLQSRTLLEGVPQRIAAREVDLLSAFESGDHERAQSALHEILLIDSSNSTAREYADRVAVLADVARLLDWARVASIENHIQGQLDALREVVDLDPARGVQLNPQIISLETRIRERRYEQFVANATTAIDSEDLPRARRHVADAAALVPGRDLSFLRIRIEEIAKRRALNAALEAATDARMDDDWAGALSAYERALRLDAAHALAVSGRALSQEILEKQRALNVYVAAPLRLTSERVARAARANIVAAAAITSHSKRLRESVSTIEFYLEKAQVPVQVAVLSDGKTDVQVRRIGIVGKHTRKVIQLTPGEYQFEGRRRGYKSHLVSLNIPFDVSQIEVSVVCDEPI